MLSICPSGPLKAATCMADRSLNERLQTFGENRSAIQVVELHLAAVGVLDGAIKHCPQLQELLDSGLQVYNLEAEKG